MLVEEEDDSRQRRKKSEMPAMDREKALYRGMTNMLGGATNAVSSTA